MPLFGPPNVEKLEAKGNIKGLIKALTYDKDWDIRQRAAEALGRIADGRTVEPLIALLIGRGTFSNWSRARAAELLGQLGDGRAVQPLVACLVDRYYDIRQSAADALEKLGWQPTADESGVQYHILKRQWQQCVEMGEPAVEALKQALWDENLTIRLCAAKTLGEIGEVSAVYDLTRLFSDREHLIRRTAVEALVQIGHPSIVEPLIGRLGDYDENIRRIAARALVALYHGETIDPQSKLSILAVRSIIEYPGKHHDIVPSCGGHEDSTANDGIGVEFPL